MLRRGFATRTTAVTFAVVALAAGLTLRALDHRYGPLHRANFAGLYSRHGFTFSKDGFSYRLSAARDATGQVIAGLDNDGAHSVEITSIEPGPMVSDIRWRALGLAAAQPHEHGGGVLQRRRGRAGLLTVEGPPSKPTRISS